MYYNSSAQPFSYSSVNKENCGTSLQVIIISVLYKHILHVTAIFFSCAYYWSNLSMAYHNKLTPAHHLLSTINLALPLNKLYSQKPESFYTKNITTHI